MLTKQENKVVNLVCVGYSDKEAADVLCVSTKTISNHKQNIFQKLGFSKTTELSAWYWCQKFNTKFDLNELKKQAIAVIFFFCTVASALDFENPTFRSRRIKSNRTKVEYSLTSV